MEAPVKKQKRSYVYKNYNFPVGRHQLKKFDSVEKLYRYYICVYYYHITKDPEIRKDEASHFKFIEHLNKKYLGAAQSNGFEDKDKFKKSIDLLTQIFTKQAAILQVQSEKQALAMKFMQGIKKPDTP